MDAQQPLQEKLPSQQIKTGHLRVGPSWKGNLMAFGLLILVMLGYFFWQADQIEKNYLKRVSEHSQMLAGLLTYSLDNAEISKKSIEETIQSFLSSVAKFIDYLESVESFTPDELTLFANEANLKGISIIRSDGQKVEGPAGWTHEEICQPSESSLLNVPEKKLYILSWPRPVESGCIFVGFDSSST